MSQEAREVLGAADEIAARPVWPQRPCVHCFRPHQAPPGVRVVCPRCRDTEAALNGGPRPAVQVAFGVNRPPGLQPWWTPDEDRVLAECRTAAEAHGRLPWRSLTACNYRFKTLRKAGRLRAFDHRCWSPDEDARVATIASPAEIPNVARALGRTVVAVHRRRGELRRAGGRVTRFRTRRPWTPTEDAVLLDSLAQRSGWRLDLPALAERLGRTRGAVSMRLTALRRQARPGPCGGGGPRPPCGQARYGRAASG